MAKQSALHQAKEPETPKETREDKLIRLGIKRVSNACRYINLVGNLGAYRPTDSQIAQIEEALGLSVAQTLNRLRGTRRESVTFTLTK